MTNYQDSIYDLSRQQTDSISEHNKMQRYGASMWEKITIKEVAQKCGVSTATISRALNNSGYVSEDLKQHILKTCNELGYIPNSTARSLKVNATGIIGYITSDISNHYHITLAKGIEDTISPSNYNLIVCSTRNNKESEVRYLKLLLGRNIDALVVNSTCDNDDFIINISQKVPTVLVNRRLNHEGFHGDFADCNNHLGTYLLTKELLKYGHKKIYIIEGSYNFSNARERYQGFKDAMDEVGLMPSDHTYLYRYEGNFTEQSGYDAIVHMLHNFEQIPTAVLCTNNATLIGALKALHYFHISIPEQLSIVGFNGVENLELMTVRPTIADYDPYTIGTSAGQFLLDRIDNLSIQNREAIFDPTILIGNATANPRII